MKVMENDNDWQFVTIGDQVCLRLFCLMSYVPRAHSFSNKEFCLTCCILAIVTSSITKVS